MVSDFKDLRHLQKIHVERNFIGNWIFPWELRSKMGLETRFWEPSTSQVVPETLGRKEDVQGYSGREDGYRQSQGWGSQPGHPADGKEPA